MLTGENIDLQGQNFTHFLSGSPARVDVFTCLYPTLPFPRSAAYAPRKYVPRIDVDNNHQNDEAALTERRGARARIEKKTALIEGHGREKLETRYKRNAHRNYTIGKVCAAPTEIVYFFLMERLLLCIQ